MTIWFAVTQTTATAYGSFCDAFHLASRRGLPFLCVAELARTFAIGKWYFQITADEIVRARSPPPPLRQDTRAGIGAMTSSTEYFYFRKLHARILLREVMAIGEVAGGLS